MPALIEITHKQRHVSCGLLARGTAVSEQLFRKDSGAVSAILRRAFVCRAVDDPIQPLAGDEGLGLFVFAFRFGKVLCVGFRFVDLKMELKWRIHVFHLHPYSAPKFGGVKQGARTTWGAWGETPAIQ